MKTAEEFLKEKGIKDTLYDVKNPEPNNWIQGGLSALLDEYRNQSHPTTLPSDEEIRKLIWEDWEGEIKEEDPREMVFKYMIWMRSLCEAKIAEMEREMKRLRFMIDNGLGAKDIQNDI